MQHSHHEFQSQASCCHPVKEGRSLPDFVLWGSVTAFVLAWALHYLMPDNESLTVFATSMVEFFREMWWGIVLGLIAVGLMDNIPRGVMESALTSKSGKKSIWRALFAGLLLDMCNHGIVLIGTKLYERGASLGQMVAFLVASPWNSFSLTLIMFSLIGVKWTLGFIALSLLIGWVSGHLFDLCVARGLLPKHPHTDSSLPARSFKAEWKEFMKDTKLADWHPKRILLQGLKDSRPIIRWMLLGVIIASAIRAFLPADFYSDWMGPTLLGLTATLIFATIIEVCSEGSVPIASDLITKGGALGNGFAFMMAGASTDYTEVTAIREATHSWKAGLFLPLITLPQILAIAYILNQ